MLELAAVATAGATNVLLNRVVPRVGVVPTALTGAGAVAWLARRGGATWEEMGLSTRGVRRGLRWGLVGALPVVIGGVVAATRPTARRALADRRIVEASPGDLLYHLALRIPFGTALPEEVIFRGALPALFRRRRSRAAAEALVAALFGCWHILPSIEQVTTHPQRRAVAGLEWLLVAGAVGVTAAGSYALTWLRDRSGSLAAPIIVHAAANVSSFAAGAADRLRSGPRPAR